MSRVIYTTNAIESVNMSFAENHQDARLIPDRRGSTETALLGVAEHRAQMDNADQGMEGGVESLCDSLRGQDACSLGTIIYTKLWTRA